MKSLYRASSLSIFMLMLAVLLAALPTRAGKAQEAVAQKQHGSTFKWKPGRIPIASEDSRFDLELPDLAPDADWIVGVQPIAGDERETISVGLVSWEDSDHNPVLARKAVKLKLMSGITEFPTRQIQVARGKARLPGLARFDANSGSLLIYLRVSPETKVHIWRGGTEFLNPSTSASFMVYNGVASSQPVKGIYSLAGRLMRSKALSANDEKRDNSQLGNLIHKSAAPAFKAFSAPAASRNHVAQQISITCTFTFSDEETETCYYVNIGFKCNDGSECSITGTLCDDGGGGIVIATTFACNF